MDSLTNPYYGSLLNTTERNAYDKLCRMCFLCNHNIQLLGSWIQAERISKIVDAVMLDNPSLFWINYYEYSIFIKLIVTELRFSFFFEGPQLKALIQEADAWQARIAGKMPMNARAVDKAWLIFDYLARQVTYEERSLAYSHTIVGPMSRHNHTAVCEGISKSYKFLCDKVGIPCIIVTGEAYFDAMRSGPHTWNMVELDGNTYHVDVTAELEFAHMTGRAGQDSFLHIDHDMRQYQWNRGIVPRCS